MIKLDKKTFWCKYRRVKNNALYVLSFYLDATTAVNLELLQNIRDPKSEHTLYGVLNYTKTIGGARLLRANILQPPCDLGTITMRQEVVLELTG